MKVLRLIDKTLQKAGRIIMFVLVGIVVWGICFASILYAATWFWPGFYGSHDLGKNIYMIEWDGGGRVIVKGSNIRGNTCYGGMQIIPTYEKQYDSAGHFAEYVIDAKSDDCWIIAKTDNHISNQRKYYILNKECYTEKGELIDSLNSGIDSFTDSSEFAKKCHRNEISIRW